MTRTIKYTFSIFLLVVLASFNCGRKKSHAPWIKCVTLFSSLQLIKPNGQYHNIIDSSSIFYYKDLVLYKVAYKNEISNFIPDTANKTFNQKYVRTETAFNYFVYKKNSFYGLVYDSLNAQQYLEVPVDSFLKSTAFQGMNFYDKQNDSLVSTEKDSKNNTVVEKYIPKTKFDQSYCDTTCLYFTKRFRDIDYSFSKELDSLRKMKLFKVMLIYNSIPEGVYPFEVPRREFLFELKEVTAYNSKEIIDFFKNFTMYR